MISQENWKKYKKGDLEKQKIPLIEDEMNLNEEY